MSFALCALKGKCPTKCKRHRTDRMLTLHVERAIKLGILKR